MIDGLSEYFLNIVGNFRVESVDPSMRLESPFSRCEKSSLTALNEDSVSRMRLLNFSLGF